MKTDYSDLLRLLITANVEFIVIGGVAGVAHGSATFTQDVDVVYRRSPENIRRLIMALADKQPYPRDVPAGLPFIWDERTIEQGLNFTLTTSIGNLDLLGEIPGGGDFERLLPDAISLSVYGVECPCLKLDKLIAVKEAAGRPKDIQSVAELRALLEEIQKGESSI